VVFRTTAELNSPAGGNLVIPAVAVTPGVLPEDALQANRFTSLRSTPSSGAVVSVTNLLAPLDGAPTETLARYRERFPRAIKCVTVGQPGTYAAAALENPSIRIATELRGSKPISLANGFFESASGHVVVTVLGLGGNPPSASVCTTIQADIAARSLFNLNSSDPALSGVHVIPMRLRLVSVQGVIYAEKSADLSTVKTTCQTAVRDYLKPLTGGQKGLGHKSGARVRMTEIYAVLENIAGVDFVNDSALIVTNTQDIAQDEIISPGVIDFDVRYA
jgi:hypothetical protein